MPRKAGTADFSKICKELLDEYGEEVLTDLNESINAAADTAVKQIQEKSKVRTGKYRAGWTHRVQTARNGVKSQIVYNADRYRIAHLLENPHRIANKYGSYGSTSGDGVIAEAEEYTENWLYDEVSKKIGGR